MLQVNNSDERIRVWQLQRELVRASVARCAKASEKDRRPLKGTERRQSHPYDRP
jgi:hypothetical protein